MTTEENTNASATQVEPIVIVRKIPRCVVCFERDGLITSMVAGGVPLDVCLVCGTPAPAPEPEQVVTALPVKRYWTKARWDLLVHELFRRKMT